MAYITFEDIKRNEVINTYIEKAHELLGVLGYTEHSFVHANKVAQTAANILTTLGFNERTAELGQIAGYIHDIGNTINRIDHAQTGAIMAFRILSELKMDTEEIATIISAIGNHDEGTGTAINPVSAALIIADKSDVRRTRVRNDDFATFDIHDRVNYAVEYSKLTVTGEKRSVLLDLIIDPEICSVMEYFEIFLTRMMMCRKATVFLDAQFELLINGAKLL